MLQTPVVLDDVRRDPARVLASTAGSSLLDLDGGVLCLEFHSKGNTLDGDTLTVAEHAFATIPGQYNGLVIGNQGKHFSFGANLRWLLSLLHEIGGDRERFHLAAKRFQRITTGMRVAPFPTVSAPFELTVGGALELTMYADRVQAHSSMRASLPEIAVGILPDLGGTSELYVRCIDSAGEGNEAAGLREAFQTIVFTRGSKDAEDARSLKFLKSHDRISTDLSSLIGEAKARVLELAPGYSAPAHRQNIPVLGDEGYAALEQAIDMAAGFGNGHAVRCGGCASGRTRHDRRTRPSPTRFSRGITRPRNALLRNAGFQRQDQSAHGIHAGARRALTQLDPALFLTRSGSW